MIQATTISRVERSDEYILETMRSGDETRALNDFVRTHQRFVFSVAIRYLNHTEDAQDAAQEALLRAVKALSGFKGDSSIKTWLYRITQNVCHSMIRKKRLLRYLPFGEGEREVNVGGSEVSPLERTQTENFAELFNRILATLPEKQRETFSLRYFDDLSYEEISDMVGTSVGALKANYHWAVKKIAAQLRETKYFEEWQMKDNR